MESVKINNVLVKIDASPAILNFNFPQMKEALTTELDKYRIVVTADTVSGAKKLAADLNKTKAAIAAKRKEAVAAVSGPVKRFEEEIKELEGMIDDGRQEILDQVKKFEDATRDLVRERLEEKRDALWATHGVTDEFQGAKYEDLVLLTSVTAKGSLTSKAALELEHRVIADKALQDRTKMRLLELENRSFKGGLAAPLTRDHVAGFLFDDDHRYESELARLMAAEGQREEQAREAQRQQNEKEMRRREAEIRAEEERKRQQDEARIRAEEQATAAKKRAEEAQERAEATQKPVHSEAPRPRTWPGLPSQNGRHDAPAGAQVAPRPSLELDEHVAQAPAPDGMVNIEVTAIFRTTVGASVLDARIEQELRKAMERAGIKTLHEIRVSRTQAPAVHEAGAAF